MTRQRRQRATAVGILLTLLLVWPRLPGVPYDLLNTAVLACEYCVAALSLVLLIGFVGQISLCQGALIGMGSFISAIGIQRAGLDFPWALLVGLVAGAATASVIGVVSLRVRGLYLAVATLIFAYVCDQYLFRQAWLVQSQSGTSIPAQSLGTPGTIPYFDFTDAHTFYFAALAIATLAVYGVANIGDSRVGRAFAAVRGSEVAAASLGIAVTRVKLLGFATAGALAGLGGALTLVGSRTVEPAQFNFMSSLYFLSIAVVGGLRSIGGAIASSLLFAILVGEVFFRFPAVSNYLDLVSAGLLIAVLLFFRGGLGAVPDIVRRVTDAAAPAARRLRERLWPRRLSDAGDDEDQMPIPVPRVLRVIGPVGRGAEAARRMLRIPGLRPRVRASDAVVSGPIDVVALRTRIAAAAPSEPPEVRVDDRVAEHDEKADLLDADRRLLMKAVARNPQVAGEPAPDGRRNPVLLEASGITVSFGGLTAVRDASLQVGAGEIVGLIGPNGAGKTTFFNSILGLNEPAQGTVILFGQDVTSWDVHRRAALGIARTFQILQLFADLTVFDNLLVATHLQHRTGLMGSLLVTPGANRSEREARARVRAVIELMGLEDVADSKVAGLPFGVLRLVEVARTLVAGGKLVCFDEAASGLDSNETEQLIEWFRFLRQIGISLLVIEHDVDMVLRLCDWIYVLDQGSVIASGRPAAIQNDPAVRASYLGDEEDVA